jgi:hypothetical protein
MNMAYANMRKQSAHVQELHRQGVYRRRHTTKQYNSVREFFEPVKVDSFAKKQSFLGRFFAILTPKRFRS